jgi:hypothetical protein
MLQRQSKKPRFHNMLAQNLWLVGMMALTLWDGLR